MSIRDSLLAVLNDIIEERGKQDDKWGEQHWPDGTNPSLAEFARLARDECHLAATIDGDLSWWHILREEFYEAGAETDWPKLRAELIQVAAVCVAWIEDGDQRA